MLTTPLESLKKYVDQPSGSFDPADVAAVAEMFAEDFQSLGFATELIPGRKFGPVLRAAIGSGDRQLMLMGHMDTVFPHDVCVPFGDMGDGRAMGSGVMDMKGGDVAAIWAVKALKELGIEGEYEGIGHCILGYAAAEPAAPAPRKENYIYRI